MIQAQIATLLCAAFIIYALKRDLKERPYPLVSIWIPFLWFALSVTKPITYWLYPSQFVAFSQRIAFRQQRFELIHDNPHERILLTLLIGMGLYVLFKRRREFVIKIKDNIWMTAFFAYGLISISWADYQGIAAKRWIRGIGDLIMVLMIVSEKNPQEALDRIMRRCAIILVPLSILFAKFYPQLGRIYTVFGRQMWVGVTGHKNQLGLLCAFCGIFLVWRLLTRWPAVDHLDASLLGITLYLLLKAKSQTSMVVFLLGFAVLLIQQRAKSDPRSLKKMLVMSLATVFLLQAVAIAFMGQSLSTAFFSAAGRDTSLTGRVPLWNELLKAGSRRALTGSGYASFWSSDDVQDLWQTVGWTPTTGHNGYIDVFLDLGLVGLIIIALFLIHTFKCIMAAYPANVSFAKLKFCFFVMILFHNMAESSMGKANTLLWLLLLLSSLACTKMEPAEAPGPAPETA